MRGRLTWLPAAARGAVRARGIAYVFQGGNLLPTFTAAENVAFAVRVAESDAEPEELLALARARDRLLERLAIHLR